MNHGSDRSNTNPKEQIMRRTGSLIYHTLFRVNSSSVRRWFLSLCCVVAAMGIFALTVYGQNYQGGLRGAVHDPNGAVVPGVEVVLTNEETNTARSAVSNSEGEYAFANVLPGTYTLTAAKSGYKKHEHKGIRNGTRERITPDVVL